MTAPSDSDKTTHFGYEQVPVAEKEKRVGRVFRSVASRYDIMNDVMSFGTHRLIKRFTLELSALRPGHKVLDLAGGTGDFGIHVSPIVGKKGQVVLADIHEVLLQIGRDRIIDKGLSNNVDFVKLNAEALPFAQNTFDCVCIAYGLRNITDKDTALASIQRVLKPGGRILILEFSKPQNKLLDRAYRAYSSFWPVIGRLITGDAHSYRYLVESIDMHPDQETLLSMMATAGLVDCKYHNVMNGICAVHTGMKPFSNASE